MKNLFIKILLVISILCIDLNKSFTQGKVDTVSIENVVSQQGTVSFILSTSKYYKNGTLFGEGYSQKLLEIPGLATCIMEVDYSGIFVSMQWKTEGSHIGFYLLFTELPGPQEYHILFTWNAEKGLSDGYFDGIPFRKENPGYYTPWHVNGQGTYYVIPLGINSVSDVVIINKYLLEKDVVNYVPKELKNKYEDLLGQKNLPPPIDITNRKGQLLYSSKLNNKASVQDWILEGPAIIDFADSSMIMRSQIPNPPDGSTGHFNYWCPNDFPSKIIIEWEFKPISDKGVCHLFFAATGHNGEDVFDPSLPERDGHFQQYINREIKNYFFIYFSNLRLMRTSNMATTWLEKSGKQSVLALGQIGIIPGNKEFHKVCVIKDGAHMQLIVNGKVCLDFTDPGDERWGPELEGGKISFRQMAVTMAAYRNFNVWELE